MGHAILTFVPCYLPGYKAGGPTRTIANMIEWLGDDIQFLVATADRDLGDTRPYAGVNINAWQAVGKAQVCYLSPSRIRFWNLPPFLRSVAYDVLYLNSFFAAATRRLLWLRRIGALPRTPVVVAPRGEFSPGALGLKRGKKRVYLALAKALRLCRDIVWQASGEHKARHIQSQFGRGRMTAGVVDSVRPHSAELAVWIAPDLPAFTADTAAPRVKTRGSARVAFVGRVARMKNLDYALRLLHETRGNIEFNIFGPPEDRAYESECQTLAANMPVEIKVMFRGGVMPAAVSGVFAQHHLLLLPTLGENFGHVIIEALRAGCPVLISDQTPWRNLSAAHAGWDLPLDKPEEFRTVLQKVIDMDQAEFDRWSTGARAHGESAAADPAVLEANRRLFSTIAPAPRFTS